MNVIHMSLSHRGRRASRALVLTAVATLASTRPVLADNPGGFIETPDTAHARPIPTYHEIQRFLPSRGPFTFPAPYKTVGVRITNENDCSEHGCQVLPVGYSYWRTMNDHVGSDTMSILVNWSYPVNNYRLYKHLLYSYNKRTDAVSDPVLLVDKRGGPLAEGVSGEMWYFSAAQPTKLYMNDESVSPRFVRYDVVTHHTEVVYDVTSAFGPGYTIWQMHSSDDDRVHSATLRARGKDLGCIAYHEDTGRFQYFAKTGEQFDECNLDRSGRWLMMLEVTPEGGPGDDMRIFDLSTGANTVTSGFKGLAPSAKLMAAGIERRVLDREGAVGHADMGYGYVVGANDNDKGHFNSIMAWDFTRNPLSGVREFDTGTGGAGAANHISHTNARADIPMREQYACASNASPVRDKPWANEILCFPLDGSFRTLVVAPVMTDMNSSVGGSDYGKQPKGNLDISGRYFMWTSNTAGSRVDAYLVKVPAQRLRHGRTTGTSPRRPSPRPLPPGEPEAPARSR